MEDLLFKSFKKDLLLEKKKHNKITCMDRLKVLSIIKRDHGIFHQGSVYFKPRSSWVASIALLLLMVPIGIKIFAKLGTNKTINSFTVQNDIEKYVIERPPDYVIYFPKEENPDCEHCLGLFPLYVSLRGLNCDQV